jgi:transposase-like protein
MSKTRRSFSAEFKAQVDLEVLKGIERFGNKVRFGNRVGSIVFR